MQPQPLHPGRQRSPLRAPQRPLPGPALSPLPSLPDARPCLPSAIQHPLLAPARVLALLWGSLAPSAPPLPGTPPRLYPVFPAPLSSAPASFSRPLLRILTLPQPDLSTRPPPLEAAAPLLPAVNAGEAGARPGGNCTDSREGLRGAEGARGP